MKNISAFLCLLLFVAPRPSLQDSPVNKLIEVLFEMAINQIQYKAKPDIKQAFKNYIKQLHFFYNLKSPIAGTILVDYKR